MMTNVKNNLPVCYDEISDLPASATAAAIGNFDGVHPGHRAVFGRMREVAEERNLRALAVTFRGNPNFSCAGKGHLLPEPQQREALSRAGVETVLRLDFERYRGYAPETFVREVLLGALHCDVVLVGENFRFGKDRAGDTELLGSVLAEAGKELIVLPSVRFEGETLSSTAVREALMAGDIGRASAMLGRPVCYELPVESGARIGRTLGFPTANQRFPEKLVLPRFGVYASEAEVGDGEIYPAVSNVGVKPTVGSAYPLIETHLLGFSGELTGKTIRVTLKKFLRAEMRFDSMYELRNQIAMDIENAGKV